MKKLKVIVPINSYIGYVEGGSMYGEYCKMVLVYIPVVNKLEFYDIDELEIIGYEEV